jgi:hypothetical protein
MAAPGAPPLTQWQVVCAIEKHGRAQGGRFARLTLGDALLALPSFQARVAPRAVVIARVAARRVRRGARAT